MKSWCLEKEGAVVLHMSFTKFAEDNLTSLLPRFSYNLRPRTDQRSNCHRLHSSQLTIHFRRSESSRNSDSVMAEIKPEERFSIEDASHDGKVVLQKGGTAVDEREMTRMGKKQELRVRVSSGISKAMLMFSAEFQIHRHR